MSDIDSIQRAHSEYIDSMLATFESHLQSIVDRANAALVSKLQKRLKITDGVIEQTPGNIKLMRRADKMFMDELESVGYSRLMKAFVGEFRGQLTYLQDIIENISDQLKTPLAKLKWSQDDLKVLANFQASSVEGIKSAVSAAAGVARNRVMLVIGGLDFKDLVSALKEAFDLTVSGAKTLAETSMMMFYRTATDLAFQEIEQDVPGQEPMRYQFFNPIDAKTRDFCVDTVRRTAKRGMTRDEIDQLDNGMLANVFVSGGGFNCRGSFVIDTRELAKRLLKAA